MSGSDRVSRVRAGDRRAMASLMRDLDDERPGAAADIAALSGVAFAATEAAQPATTDATAGGDAGGDAALGSNALPDRAGAANVVGSAFVVGVTGAPGVGKSTLVDALVARWRARGAPVGVVAVDPSSPIGGGAILGDRVRMQRHATDDGVFIRSIASRGAAGGLSRSANEIIAVLAAGGFPSILVETVGVGQTEVEIAAAADVTVVVTVPGLGDDVQTLKAGVLEIADVLVVNKSDRPGAEQTARELEAMVELRRASARVRHDGVATGPAANAGAEPRVVRVTATSGEGMDELDAAIDAFRAVGAGAGDAARAASRRRRRAEARIVSVAAARIATLAREALGPGGDAADLADAVAARRLDAGTAADALMARLHGRY